jgi:hypothetical protein
MCDIPGSMAPVSSQVVAVAAAAAPIDMRKVVQPASFSSSLHFELLINFMRERCSCHLTRAPAGAADRVEQRHCNRFLAGA